MKDQTNQPSGVQTQDPARLRAHGSQAGEHVGREALPVSVVEGTAEDHSIAGAASAKTAADVHLAEHCSGNRPRLDGAIAEAMALVVRLTAVVSDLLFKVSAADHKVQSLQQLPLPAQRDPWPGWLRIGLLLLMALGSGAALAGALLELTSDAWYYVWGFCLATSAGMVGLGAWLAHLARNFEFNRLRANEFTAGVLPKVIFGIGAVFALLLMVALASIRGTAAEADAACQSRTDDGLTVLLPDQAAEADSQASSDQDETPLPSVPAYAYGLIEGVLALASFGVEYVNHLPWAEQRRRAKRELTTTEQTWRIGSNQLGPACGQLMARLAERAAQDAAVLLAGEATLAHVAAEVSDYRRAVLVHHPSLDSDPFAYRRNRLGQPSSGTSNADQPDDPIAVQVARRWGRDLQPAGLIEPDVAYDHLDVEQLAPTALARGLAVLAQVPERAAFTPVTWDPAALVENAHLAGASGTDRSIGIKARPSSGRQSGKRAPSGKRRTAAASRNGSQS